MRKIPGGGKLLYICTLEQNMDENLTKYGWDFLFFM